MIDFRIQVEEDDKDEELNDNQNKLKALEK